MADPTERQALLARLRGAVGYLAGPPQAQRRWVKLGRMGPSTKRLEEELDKLPDYAAAGLLTADQAALLDALRRELAEVRDGSGDFFAERRAAAEPAFLHSNALETPDWHRLRHLARRCFSSLRSAPLPEGFFAR
jgi:hypothetical protein